MVELRLEDRTAAIKLFIDELVAKSHINSLLDVQKVSVHDLLFGSLGDTYSFIISLETNEDKTFSALKLKEGKEIDSSTIDIAVSDFGDFELRCTNDYVESINIQLSGDGFIRSIRSAINLIGSNEKVVVKELFIIM